MPILTSVRWHLIVGGFFKIYVFIYYLSLAVLGLHCRLFSGCSKRELLSSDARASHYSSFSLQNTGSRVHKLRVLQHVGSVIVGPGL